VLREPGATKSSFTTTLVAGFVFHGLVLLNLVVDKSGWVAARIPAGVDSLLNTLAFIGHPEISDTVVTMTKS